VKPVAALFLLGALVGTVVCVKLGLWQWGRWQVRREILLSLERAQSEPPRVYGDSLPAAEQVMGRRISLTGRYDETRQFLLRGRPHDGEQGVEVVTPLVLTSNQAVLVNRGWLEAVDGATARPQDYPEPGHRAVVGYVEPLARGRAGFPYLKLPSDSLTLFSAAFLDPDSVAARLPYLVADFWLRESPGPAAGPRPRRLPPERPNPGMHLGYAIQWFAIAALILAGSAWRLASTRGRHTGPDRGSA